MESLGQAAANASMLGHPIVVGGITQGFFYSPLSTWGLVFQFIGALIILVCYAPGSISAMRTKQTYGLSFTMWVVTIIALTSLALFAWLGLANTIHSPGQFIVVALSESISLLFSLIIFTIKISNVMHAKKLGITEEKYCKSLLDKKNIKVAK